MSTQPLSNDISHSNNSFKGGISSIVSGAITLLVVIYYWSFVGPFFAFGGLMVALLLSSILAIIGGILAVKRKEWALALIGAIASIGSFAGRRA